MHEYGGLNEYQGGSLLYLTMTLLCSTPTIVQLHILIYQFSSIRLKIADVYTERRMVQVSYWNYCGSNELRLKPVIFSANPIALS